MAVLDLLKAQKAPVSLKNLSRFRFGYVRAYGTSFGWRLFVSDGAIEKQEKNVRRDMLPQSISPQTIYHLVRTVYRRSFMLVGLF